MPGSWSADAGRSRTCLTARAGVLAEFLATAALDRTRTRRRTRELRSRLEGSSSSNFSVRSSRTPRPPPRRGYSLPHAGPADLSVVSCLWRSSPLSSAATTRVENTTYDRGYNGRLTRGKTPRPVVVSGPGTLALWPAAVLERVPRAPSTPRPCWPARLGCEPDGQQRAAHRHRRPAPRTPDAHRRSVQGYGREPDVPAQHGAEPAGAQQVVHPGGAARRRAGRLLHHAAQRAAAYVFVGHRAWLAVPGKTGKPHQPNSMREIEQPAAKYSRERWDLLVHAADTVPCWLPDWVFDWLRAPGCPPAIPASSSRRTA